MRRRRAQPQDSLELLLDTISNVFGGILLMAILIVLQAQASVSRVTAEPAATPLLRQAELDLARAVREAEALRDEVQAIRARSPDFEQLSEIAARKAEFLGAIEQAQDRLQEERSMIDRLSQVAGTSEREQAELEERLREREAALKDGKRRLGAVRQAARQNVRLPLRHEHSGGQRSILIDGDALYGLPEDCDAEPSPKRTFATRYTPRSGQGHDAGTDPTAELAVRALLAGHRGARVMVSFWVSDQDASFATFQRARAVANELGFSYSVGPYQRTEGLIVIPGRPDAE